VRVLVLGGTRFIGPSVVRRLVDAGHDVILFHRGETETDLRASVTHLHGERARLADHRAALVDAAPDVMLDMAPMNDADARAAVEACDGLASRLVAISSVDVYRAYGIFHRIEDAPVETGRLREESPLRERLYPYRGKSAGLDDYDKVLAERVVMAHPSVTGTVLRLPAVYGERDYQYRVFFELAHMDAGRRLLLQEDVAGWRWSRAYVDNVAHAIVLAVTDERAAGRVYNVAEADTLTYEQWLRALGAAAGWHGEIILVPPERMPPHMRMPGNLAQHIDADSARIRRELGFEEQVRRDEGLRRTVDWQRANPPPGVDPKSFDYSAEDAVLRELGR
jgi:nucleoside-diphosphate-sugar epimerase